MIGLLLLASMLAAMPVFSQSLQPQVVNIAGGSYSDPNSYFRVDWSVGELALVNTSPMPANYIVTNGFLQPFVDKFTTNDDHQFGVDEIFVFPNPASSYVEINFKTKQKGEVRFKLYNALGQRLYEKSFKSYGLDRIEKIPMSQFATGTFILYIELDATTGSVDKKGSYKIVKAR